MEELAEKIDVILEQLAHCSSVPSSTRPDSRKHVQARLKDGTQMQVECSADMLLGIGEDEREKLTEQIRFSGLEVDALEMPRIVPSKETWQNISALQQAFQKAWLSRVDLAEFCDMVSSCGERLLALRRYDLAYSEVFYRFSDRAVQIRAQIEKKAEGFEGKVAAFSRFYLGSSFALYQQTINRDDAARRSDTVDTLRDVLRDILMAVDILCNQTEAIREELYWCMYNSSLLAIRIARWLRIHGFGGICVQPLSLLSDAMQTCLPLMAVHMLPFRCRFVQELAYCAEAGKQLGEASRVCDAALEHIAHAQKLETFLPPVPPETTKAFEVMQLHFKMLKAKYDFWLGKAADAGQLSARAKEIVPDSAPVLVSCLLEALQFQHGLPQQFGAEDAKCVLLDGVPEDPTAPEGVELTRFSRTDLQAKQVDLLAALVDLLTPLADKAEAATEALETHTVKRLKWEAEEETRARTDEPKVNEDGEEVEPDPRPQRPDADSLEAMGFPPGCKMHALEEALPLAAHAWLVEQCLRHEVRGNGARIEGAFAKLERSLALRLRYRHFLRTPIIDVDTITSTESDLNKVQLPEHYELLAGDLNHFSQLNQPGAGGADVDDTGEPVVPQGRHIYLIGRRFDPWENWTSEYPVRIRRLCNMKFAFLPVDAEIHESRGAPQGALGWHEPGPVEIKGKANRPWMASYCTAGAGDSSGFDLTQESEELREGLVRKFTKSGIFSPRCLQIPVDPHPGNAATGQPDMIPCLFYSVYDERALWTTDDQAERRMEDTMPASDEQTLLPEAADQAAEEAKTANSEKLLPPWSPQMDSAALAAHTVIDLSASVTKHMHASVPHPSFNAVMRSDLRQTPGELQGKPFQSYVMLCAALEAPSTALVTRRLRILRALHSLWKAKARGGDDFFSEQAPDGGGAEGEGAEVAEAEGPLSPKGRWKHPEVMDRLLELGDCLRRATEEQGQLFVASAADFLEDVCAYTFLNFAWPKLCFVQELLQQHELQERVLKDRERSDISEWSHVLRRLLPTLLRTLEKVQTIDALTLASAGYALSQLFMEEQDSRSAQRELGLAIVRLEKELADASTPGPQARLDGQTAAALSFDPPSIRSPNFALFQSTPEAEAGSALTDATPGSPQGSPRRKDDPDDKMLLKSLPRMQQDRLCLLTRLYDRWIDCSLVMHLKNPAAPIRRKLRPNEVVDTEPEIQVAGELASTRLTLSNQEAGVLGRLGENPYLRCLFFVSVAQRRTDVATAALGKAVAEADTAVAQECNLWLTQEKEHLRQQKGVRAKEQFGQEFKRSGRLQRKPRSHQPIVVARRPGCIQLRLPPLLGSPDPPALPFAGELNPPPQEYSARFHSKRIGAKSPGNTQMTCAVFGKTSGVGTAVAEMHKDLPGTGVRRMGGDLVEVLGLKPNTNYCFATMYFEGFEDNRPALSSIGDTSPAVGAYYPLPVTLLRIKICKAAIRAGESGEITLKKAWVPLFDSFCERAAPSEEYDSYGVRVYKLRLDAADRFPPAVTTAFAELILLRHSTMLASPAVKAGKPQKGSSFPCTRPAQRAVLQCVNECLVAVDCSRRAGASIITRQAVSLTLELLAGLLQYRTKPQVLFVALSKCMTSLEAFPLPERQLPWHSKARTMAMYLLHQVTVLCVQLRQVNFLTKQLEEDKPERYEANPMADAGEKAELKKLLLDQALELALLGGEQWPHAEKKARVALKDSEDADEITRLLKELSDRNYSAAASASAALVLREEPARPYYALTLLQCAASRAWEQGELSESISSVLEKHECSQVLTDMLKNRQKEVSKHGFLLRSLPPVRLIFAEKTQAELEEEAMQATGGGGAGGDADETTIKPADLNSTQVAPAEEGEGAEDAPQLDVGATSDSEVLAQLELARAAPLLKELSSLKRLRHDISRFKFLDLKQVAVPLLSPDGATLGVYEEEQAADGDVSEEEGEYDTPREEPAEPADWEKQEAANKEAQEKGFKLLEELLRILARAAGYAASRQADMLLQTALMAALNALFLVGPAPEECVPKGPKSNPMDIDPDMFVGVEETVEEESPEADGAEGLPDAEPPPGDPIWLSLSVISQLAVGALQRLKGKFAAVDRQRAATRSKETGSVEEASEEDRVINVANEASKELQGADEELHDVWFEKVPELDVTSVAKLVGFSVLCLYHMRRWSNIIVMCRGFNDATCSVFATTFLPLMIGAQKEIVNLSNRAMANTQRYLAESKATFEADQKKLPRKLLRQLALQGELSEPEKLFKKRSEYYEAFYKRQKRVHSSWQLLMTSLDGAYSLVARAVPAAMEQLRKSRLVLAEYLQDRQKFSLEVQRGQLVFPEKGIREQALKLAHSLLVSSYRKAVELLRKRQMSDQVVQALHELGNLLWLEGDAAGARAAWSDAVDTVFQFVYAIKNWQKCVAEAVTPPQDAARAEIMLLTVVILAKHARLTRPKDATVHLNAALFSSSIVEAILTTALPNPPRRSLFAPSRYRLRELFFGLRETRLLLPPNSVYGGLDGMTFLGAFDFFQNTLIAMDYQPARCLPMCALHNYITTDVCRNLALAVKGRLVAAKSLIRCRSLSDAWLALWSIAKVQDKPRAMLTRELLDNLVVEAQDMTATAPFRCNEEPYSEANMQAVKELLDFALPAAGAGCGEGEEALTTSGTGALNLWTFKFLKADFVITVCSYERVFPKLNEPEEKERIAWLDKADALLVEIWKDVTGNDDDREAWSSASKEAQEMKQPARPLTVEEGELCTEVRLLRAKVQECKGDLAKAIQEVLYGMNFLQLLAASGGVKRGEECNFGSSHHTQLRTHPGFKSWTRLRRYMVQLLVSQGRLKAAAAHIQQGLAETKETRDDVARVELLAAKVRMEVLKGRLLELQGHRHLGAVPAAECCLATAARNMPIPTPSAVYARMMLFTLLQQNPSLASLQREEESAEALEATGGAEEEVLDPNEMLLLEASGKIILSPIAQQLQSKKSQQQATAAGGIASAEGFRERQKLLADMVAQCVSDLDHLLDVQGFLLRPHNINSYMDFGKDGLESEALKRPPDEPLLPPLKNGFRDRPQSDSRESQNVYLELMPLRLHCELTLVSLRLELGEMDEAQRLLKDAEARMARCVFLKPWQYIQFADLKLRWRRLMHLLGMATTSAALDAPNAMLYRDPKTFAAGIAPPTDSPLYRTFIERACTLSLASDSEWVPPAERGPDDTLQMFIQELLGVIKISLREGGNDFKQLLELLREGLEEVLRVEAILLRDPERSPAFERSYPFFASFAAVAACRKALLFPGKDMVKGAAGPPPVDIEKIPLRVALDMQRQLQRQEVEGALAYSPPALQAAQKQLLFRSVLRHFTALRRECDLFGGGLFGPERLLCDQMHVTLSQCSEAYAKAKVLNEDQLKGLETPGEVPVGGDVFVLWTRPDLTAAGKASASGPPPSECSSLLVFVCPSVSEDEEGQWSGVEGGQAPAESRPLVARSKAVHSAALRSLADTLSTDLEHCRPAVAVATEHVERRLREVACVLRGPDAGGAAEAGGDQRFDACLQQLLVDLAGDKADPDGGRPTLLDSELVQAALQATIRLLDPNLGAAQASHPELGRFLRALFAPLNLFPGR
eukprot:TRINITY_DN36370_c0_g1_i1.p1 TRINITY_DN36370_c0_g1~~TRINITY_DN36370_c0_g1_i1.p1  ORF type:complete len:3594 (+),score=919.56 TRINITY_DN36370_c0_g1_i1:56-10837(+)